MIQYQQVGFGESPTCQDKVYVQHKVGNVTYEVMSATGSLMPIVMLADRQTDVILETCVRDSYMQRDGVMLDITTTGQSTNN